MCGILFSLNADSDFVSCLEMQTNVGEYGKQSI